MSYYFTVWEGPAPLSNAHATSEYQRLMAAPSQEPPVSAIVEFIGVLERTYPGRSEPGAEPSPILDAPLLPKAGGSSVTFSVAAHATDDVRKLVEETAADLELIAFDPQLSELIPSAVTLARTAEFDMPASAELPLHLAAVMGEALDVGDTMAGIVEHIETALYVQWMTQDGQLTVEAQGEQLVPAELRLDEAGREAMLGLGFVEDEPNWSMHWDDGYEALQQAAQILSHVLVTVRTLPLGAPMRLQTFPV